MCDRARDYEPAVQRGLPEGGCGPSHMTRRAVADARSGLLVEQEVQGRDVTLGEGSNRRDIHDSGYAPRRMRVTRSISAPCSVTRTPAHWREVAPPALHRT